MSRKLSALLFVASAAITGTGALSQSAEAVEVRWGRVQASACRPSSSNAEGTGKLLFTGDSYENDDSSYGGALTCTFMDGSYIPKANVTTANIYVKDLSSAQNVTASACSVSSSGFSYSCGVSSSTSGTGATYLSISDLTYWGSTYSSYQGWISITLPAKEYSGGWNYSKFYGFYVGGAV